MMTSRRVALLLALAATAACGRGEPAEARAAVKVDSARPAAQALAEFRAGLPETADLGGSFATDRDTLVARFVSALQTSDTVAFMPMMMSRAEFAWLYYEHDPQVRPPYDLPPDMMWSQMMSQGERGIARALGRFGGRPLQFAGYACDDEAQRGPIRVWTQCRLDVLDPHGARAKVRLFGGIIEHRGRYKILSYANEL